MFRKTIASELVIKNGYFIATESYWFLGVLLYRRDVLIHT